MSGAALSARGCRSNGPGAGQPGDAVVAYWAAVWVAAWVAAAPAGPG